MADTVTTVAVLEDADTVAAALTPIRRRLLALLRDPHSASSLGAMTGLTRQKVNYHLRELERLGLVELVEERPKRGFTERIFTVTAERVLIDPELLAGDAPPMPAADEASAAHLAATAARAVHEVAVLMRHARTEEQRLATFTLDAGVTFASPDDMRAFVADLADLVARYDRPHARGGRRHRVVALSHPLQTQPIRDEEDVR